MELPPQYPGEGVYWLREKEYEVHHYRGVPYPSAGPLPLIRTVPLPVSRGAMLWNVREPPSCHTVWPSNYLSFPLLHLHQPAILRTPFLPFYLGIRPKQGEAINAGTVLLELYEFFRRGPFLGRGSELVSLIDKDCRVTEDFRWGYMLDGYECFTGFFLNNYYPWCLFMHFRQCSMKNSVF